MWMKLTNRVEQTKKLKNVCSDINDMLKLAKRYGLFKGIYIPSRNKEMLKNNSGE